MQESTFGVRFNAKLDRVTVLTEARSDRHITMLNESSLRRLVNKESFLPLFLLLLLLPTPTPALLLFHQLSTS